MINSELIDQENYQFIEEIRVGKYGKRVKTIEKKTGQLIVLNIQFLDKNQHHEKEYASWLNRKKEHILNWNSLHNPVILELKDSRIFTNDKNQAICYLITKYATNGCVFSLTKEYLKTNGARHEKMNPTIRSKIIFGIASMMSYLHHINIGNKSISIDHIYLDENFDPKNECDLYKIPYTLPVYISMFHLEDENLKNKMNDVYSFGDMIYFMFVYDKLFYDREEGSELEGAILHGWNLKKPDLMPDCYWDLVLKCWNASKCCLCFDEIVEILKNDKFAINEFGMKTNIDELHDYQNRIEPNTDIIID